MPTPSNASNLLYHQYLRTDTPMAPINEQPSTQSNAAPCAAPNPSFHQPHFHWDVQASCRSLVPAFKFISDGLAKHGLQIALLVSEQDPLVIPVWQLPKKSQCLLTRLVRKACIKYNICPDWMAALASLDSTKDLPRVFEAHSPNSYIIRRSLLQNEVIFAGEGLMLLSFDHIYTLKQLLCKLAKRDCVPYCREICLSSCVYLLHRINTIHNGNKFSKGYLARVYLDIPFHEAALDEVMTEYDTTFCTASIRRIDSDLSFTVFSPDDNIAKPTLPLCPNSIPELAEDTLPAELVSPLGDVDLQSRIPWKLNTRHTAPAELDDRMSHVAVTHPKIRRPEESPLPAQAAEFAMATPFSPRPPTKTIQRKPVPPPLPPPPPPSLPSRISDTTHLAVPLSPTSEYPSIFPSREPSPLHVIKRASTEPTTLLHGATAEYKSIIQQQEKALTALEQSILEEEETEHVPVEKLNAAPLANQCDKLQRKEEAARLRAEEESERLQREEDRKQWEQEEKARVQEFEATSRLIVESWSMGVNQSEVVCSKCFDVVEQPRRYTLCY